MPQKQTIIVITGPTGVGKTELCLKLAEHYGVDIINADSRQIFAEIPTGTAAPTTEQRRRVRHYCVATHHIGDYYSASMYEQDVLQLLKTKPFSEREGIAAILSGGSMMYIDAVCNGIDDIPTVDDTTRLWMKKRLETEGLQALLEELRRLDPEHWAIVDHNNPRRVVHALEICHVSGRTYTSFRKGDKKPRPFNVIKIGLTIEREELYKRINQRVLDMVENGLIEEARSMLPYRHENALNTVGYKELFKYFDEEIPLEEAIRQIQSNTRQYARKQLTWYKKDPDITWFSPEDIERITKHIDNTKTNI